jgi:hypothetical protein
MLFQRRTMLLLLYLYNNEKEDQQKEQLAEHEIGGLEGEKAKNEECVASVGSERAFFFKTLFRDRTKSGSLQVLSMMELITKHNIASGFPVFAR